jgi:hypothetical protein
LPTSLRADLEVRPRVRRLVLHRECDHSRAHPTAGIPHDGSGLSPMSTREKSSTIVP